MGEGGFWKRRMEANRTAAIPALLKLLEQHGRIENFRIAKSRLTTERSEWYTRDSDTFKWIEACALALESDEDSHLRALMDRVVDWVIDAQYEDGYLNTYFSGARLPERFTKLRSDHELYSAGHLFQAAVAHHRVTGSDKLLSCAVRFADLICETVGPGKLEEADGHPEVELALVELYRETGTKSYLDLAGFLLDVQGFKEKTFLEGHAVKAMYLAEGGADYYSETGDEATWQALQRLWKDLSTNKVYLTGGIGSRYHTEAIGLPYELPNERAYAETCAAAANGFWAFRMLGITGESAYTDMLERAFYNGFLSCISLRGTDYFYCNPLANFSEYKRVDFFTVCCCPTNVVRTLAAIPGYIYGESDDGLWVHLYEDSRVDWRLRDGTPVSLEQRTGYPWDGQVRLSVSLPQARQFTLYLRIPGWCRSASVRVNGEAVAAEPGRYLPIRRIWSQSDIVEPDFAMPVEVIEADRRISDSHGRVALQRGPLVYCLESTDNPGVNLRDAALGDPESLSAKWQAELLGGMVAIHGEGVEIKQGENAPMYRPVGTAALEASDFELTAIPYYAWANRGISDMTVWLQRKP